MTKRLFGSLVVAGGLAMLLVVLSLVLSGDSTKASSAQGPAQQSKPSGKGAAAPAVGSWSDIQPFPTISVSPTPGSYPMRLKRAGAAAYSPNGKLYVLGGRQGTDGEDVTMTYIWEYDPAANSWTRKNAQLDPGPFGSRYTANMSVSTLTDATGVHIYAIGGSDINSEITSTVRIYDPVADSVTLLTTDPWPANPVRIPGASAVYNNKLYIYGGFSALGNGAVFTDTWRFDPMAAPGQKWTQITSASLSVARGYIGGTVLDGKIYAIGGDMWVTSTHTLSPTYTVERMDPTQPNPTWTTLASLPTPRGDLGAWAYDTGSPYEIAGHVVAAGGHYDVPDANAYVYDPTVNSWSSFPSLVHATRNFGYAQLNGYLYAFGGYDYTNNMPQGANWNQRYDATGPPQTPSPTVTGTPPTNTPTSTPTDTPLATATACGTNYNYATATATIVPGTVDTGNHTDDGVTDISLPFPVQLYGSTYSTVGLDSNGRALFNGGGSEYSNACLPATGETYVIMPLWDDLYTANSGYGIYTSVSGSAPNRIFNIEWRAQFYPGSGTANFELRLYEQVDRFDIIYGTVTTTNSSTVGVQKDDATYTQFTCDGSGGTIANGLELVFTRPPCLTATATVVPPTSTNTAVPPTNTATTVPPSSTVVASSTVAATVTSVVTGTPVEPTPCALSFTDVPSTDPFYVYIRCLACRGIVSGYSDGTFRPYNNITRGQVSKVVSNAAGFSDPIPSDRQTYADVPGTDTFWEWIERLTVHGVMGGYECGGVGEPCDPQSRPYFRPYANATRAQLAKIDSNAAGYIEPATGQYFSDVSPAHPFYVWIQRLASRGIMSGYPCGGAGEPCDPENRPYFRPYNDVTRGQASKIVANTFYPNCVTPRK